MLKKWDAFVTRKATELGEKKFFFLFIKLPVIALSAYAMLVTAFALWSFHKNVQVSQDFLKMEEACERLQQSFRERERYQTQYRRSQEALRYGQTANALQGR